MSSIAPSTRSTKPSPTANTKASRLPAPSLFVGPPSRNTSQLSVSRQLAPDAGRSTREPLARQRSALSRQYEPAETQPEEPEKDSKESTRLRKDSERETEARWKEMQSTLNEVEMTAQSSTHVFGESHANALDELRDAQVALAWAWGRGSEESGLLNSVSFDNTISQFSMDGERRQSAADATGGRGESARTRQRADTQASMSTVLSDESVRSEDTTRESRTQMEDETAEDIRRASERRGKNEEYFRMVEKSVSDVVGKLDIVAEAMRGVEAESRSLWSGSSTMESASETGGRGRASSKGAVAVD